LGALGKLEQTRGISLRFNSGSADVGEQVRKMVEADAEFATGRGDRI
jgi:hypothetical protein